MPKIYTFKRGVMRTVVWNSMKSKHAPLTKIGASLKWGAMRSVVWNSIKSKHVPLTNIGESLCVYRPSSFDWPVWRFSGKKKKIKGQKIFLVIKTPGVRTISILNTKMSHTLCNFGYCTQICIHGNVPGRRSNAVQGSVYHASEIVTHDSEWQKRMLSTTLEAVLLEARCLWTPSLEIWLKKEATWDIEFPSDLVQWIVRLKVDNLEAKYEENLNGRSFGVFRLFVLGKAFEFWKKSQIYGVLLTPAFRSQTGMTEQHFHDLWSCITYRKQASRGWRHYFRAPPLGARQLLME